MFLLPPDVGPRSFPKEVVSRSRIFASQNDERNRSSRINGQTHYLERQIPYDDVGLRCFLSTAPNRKLITFVHGYGGDPISTWADFDRLSREQPQLQGYDLLFYDYDGLRAELRASVNLFYDFLAWLFASPVVEINNSLPKACERPLSFGYDKVVLVCHSLGAVVARLALLRATQEKKSWASRVILVLFAPAHKGARVVELALEVTTHFGFLSLFNLGVRFELSASRPAEKGLKGTHGARDRNQS